MTASPAVYEERIRLLQNLYDELFAQTEQLRTERRQAIDALRDIRGYILAAIGDADGQRAIELHRTLTLTAGQVQCLHEGLGLLDALVKLGEQP